MEKREAECRSPHLLVTLLVGAIGLSIFAALGIFSVLWLISITSHTFGADYQIYLDAYGRARAGLNPYFPYSVGTSYVNHPFLLVAVRLLFTRGTLHSKIIWSGVSTSAWIVSFIAIVSLLSLQARTPQEHKSALLTTPWLLVAFLLFGPFLETVTIGQVNNIALLFLTASLILSEANRPIPAGIALGLAIVLKTSPVIFLPYFVLTRRYRIVVSTVASTALLSILSQLPFPTDVVGPFLAILPMLSSEIHPTPYNLSLISTTFRLLDISPAQGLEAPIRLLNTALVGTLLAILFLFGWRKTSSMSRSWLFACFLILMLLGSPLLWYHHLVFMMVPLYLLLQHNSIPIRFVGVLALCLFQVQRYFEHYFARLPWPTLCGLALLLIIAYATFIKSQLELSYRDTPPPNNSLEPIRPA